MRCGLTFFLFLCGCLLVDSVNAEYMQAFTGNTRAATTGTSGKMTGNFAVLDRLAGGSPGDVFGTGLSNFDILLTLGSGSAAFDTSARYLYLYQLTHDPASTVSFSAFAVPNTDSSITSFGRWNASFSDNSGFISTTNAFGGDGNPFAQFSPAYVGVDNPDVAAQGGLTAPQTLTLSPTALNASFVFLGSYLLQPGKTSQLLGYTSNRAPMLVTNTDGFSGTLPKLSAFTELPPVSMVPEPSSGLLALCSLCSWFLLRRRPTSA
jgi:hypothetical protein